MAREFPLVPATFEYSQAIKVFVEVYRKGIKESNLKHDKIFRIQCIINNKVCNVIMSHGSSENMVSKILVKALNLKTEKYSSCYQVSLDKKEDKKFKKWRYAKFQFL